jgi:predicted phage-related endonuclease
MPRWIEGAPQGSALWLKHKCGVLSGSRIAPLFKGTAEKKHKLKLELIAERLTNQITEVFVNDAMKHGLAYEEEARQMYEIATGNIVEICGMAMHDSIEWLGCSADGLINDDGIWEAKCPSLTTFLQYRLDDVVPEMYKPQLLLEILVTGRKWADFTAYHPYLPSEINLFIKRYTPTAEELADCESKAIAFLSEVADLEQKILQGAIHDND